jgi:hypothetical protein
MSANTAATHTNCIKLAIKPLINLSNASLVKFQASHHSASLSHGSHEEFIPGICWASAVE